MTATVHLALATRIFIAICTRTFFQPDEYFQSLEPAYHAVFGYAQMTWEWKASRPIRSIFYPAINIPIFWFLKVSGLANYAFLGDHVLVYGPRALHGLLAAATDIWLCEIVRQWLGSQYITTTLFLSLTSFFHALCLSRSLSNSVETSLTTIAFAYYPWNYRHESAPKLIYDRSRMKKTLIFSALACMARPTNGIIWIYMYGKLLWALRSRGDAMRAFVFQGLVTGIVSGSFLFVIDSLYFGRPTITPVNFLSANLSSVSVFYGSSPWHYYLTQAIPILCTTALPFTLHGMYLVLRNQPSTAMQNMLETVLWTLCVYSFAGHKEWRFIHPILPLLHVFAAKSLVTLSPAQEKSESRRRRAWLQIRRYHVNFLLLSVPASVYVVLFHNSAPISVLSYIRSLPAGELLNGGIGFLTPCHSTPGHVYINREYLAHGNMWSLGCEPPLQGQNLATYQDQTDVFFASPLNYLQDYFPPKVNSSFPLSPFPASIPGAPAPDGHPWKHEWPRYLVFYGALLEEKSVRALFEAGGYKEVWRRGWEWEGEGHRKGGIRVWKWIP